MGDIDEHRVETIVEAATAVYLGGRRPGAGRAGAAQGRGVWWDLCVGRLEDGLEQAFEVIEQACDELPPIW